MTDALVCDRIGFSSLEILKEYRIIRYTVLYQLHWLPIRQRIDFEIAVFVYNALHGRGPAYLSRTCNPVREVGARAHLRSAIRGDLTVPRTRTRRFGLRSFRVSGPVVWNSLPEDIQTPELSLERFKNLC